MPLFNIAQLFIRTKNDNNYTGISKSRGGISERTTYMQEISQLKATDG